MQFQLLVLNLKLILLMTAYKEILKTIKNLKQINETISKECLLKVLIAVKSITKHTDAIDSLINFFMILEKTQIYTKQLTGREQQILMLIGGGESSIQIAKNLSLSTSTIETHRKNIRKKLNMTGNGKLIQFATIYNLKQPISKNIVGEN